MIKKLIADIQDGTHLASSKDIPNAYIGAVLSDDTNQIVRQAKFKEVDDGYTDENVNFELAVVNDDYELEVVDDCEIEVFDDDETEDDGDENESLKKGAAILIGGLAVAGAVSIGRAIWKGVGKLRAKAAEKKAAKSEGNIKKGNKPNIVQLCKKRFPDVDWFCDHYNSYLNDQPGFDDSCYIWVCTKCGYDTNISSDNICTSKDLENTDTPINVVKSAR